MPMRGISCMLQTLSICSLISGLLTTWESFFQVPVVSHTAEIAALTSSIGAGR